MIQSLGTPGPMTPWHEDDYGGWHRMLTGGERVVATVDAYPENMGGGYFYCVGDGPTEESSEETFETTKSAKDAADVRLYANGYTDKVMD